MNLLQRLIDAGTPSDLVAEVAALMGEAKALEQRRAADRERKAKSRDSNRGQQASHVTSGKSGTAPRAEPSTTTSEITNKNKGLNISRAMPARETPRDELSAVLDDEHAAAVVEHRQRLGKALTPHAARLLAKRLGAQPDPNAAADTMIERGWLSFDPTWLKGRGSTGPPAGKPMNGWESLFLNPSQRPDEPDYDLDLPTVSSAASGHA